MTGPDDSRTAPPMTHRVIGGPWPERIGLPCRIVPPLRDEYPWSPYRKQRGQVVIWIDDDPLNGNETAEELRDWTCCIYADSIAPIEAD